LCLVSNFVPVLASVSFPIYSSRLILVMIPTLLYSTLIATFPFVLAGEYTYKMFRLILYAWPACGIPVLARPFTHSSHSIWFWFLSALILFGSCIYRVHESWTAVDLLPLIALVPTFVSRLLVLLWVALWVQ